MLKAYHHIYKSFQYFGDMPLLCSAKRRCRMPQCIFCASVWASQGLSYPSPCQRSWIYTLQISIDADMHVYRWCSKFHSFRTMSYVTMCIYNSWVFGKNDAYYLLIQQTQSHGWSRNSFGHHVGPNAPWVARQKFADPACVCGRTSRANKGREKVPRFVWRIWQLNTPG